MVCRGLGAGWWEVGVNPISLLLSGWGGHIPAKTQGFWSYALRVALYSCRDGAFAFEPDTDALDDLFDCLVMNAQTLPYLTVAVAMGEQLSIGALALGKTVEEVFNGAITQQGFNFTARVVWLLPNHLKGFHGHGAKSECLIELAAHDGVA